VDLVRAQPLLPGGVSSNALARRLADTAACDDDALAGAETALRLGAAADHALAAQHLRELLDNVADCCDME